MNENYMIRYDSKDHKTGEDVEMTVPVGIKK